MYGVLSSYFCSIFLLTCALWYHRHGHLLQRRVYECHRYKVSDLAKYGCKKSTAQWCLFPDFSPLVWPSACLKRGAVLGINFGDKKFLYFLYFLSFQTILTQAHDQTFKVPLQQTLHLFPHLLKGDLCHILNQVEVWTLIGPLFVIRRPQIILLSGKWWAQNCFKLFV